MCIKATLRLRAAGEARSMLLSKYTHIPGSHNANMEWIKALSQFNQLAEKRRQIKHRKKDAKRLAKAKANGQQKFN